MKPTSTGGRGRPTIPPPPMPDEFTEYEYDDGSAGASGGWRSVGLGYIVVTAAVFLAVALLFIFA